MPSWDLAGTAAAATPNAGVPPWASPSGSLDLVPCPDGSGYYCPAPTQDTFAQPSWARGGNNPSGILTQVESPPFAVDPISPIPILPLPRVTLTCKHGCTPGVNCPLGCAKKKKGPSWAGLGDVLPYGYILQGTRIHYEAELTGDLIGPSSTEIANCLQGQLAPALIAVQANASLPFIGGGKIAVDGTVGFDRNSINDIQGDITAQIAACGGTATNVRIAVVSSPGVLPAGIPSSTGQAAPGSPLPSSSLFLGLPASIWGISTGVLIALGIGVLIYLRR